MKQTVVTAGNMIDEYTIRVTQPLIGISGRVKLTIEIPDTQETQLETDFDRYFANINIDVSNFQFDRNEANER